MSSAYNELAWSIYPYLSGLLHWHLGNRMIAPVPEKQPWKIWVKLAITKPQQNTRDQKSLYTFLIIYCKCFSFCSVTKSQQNETQQNVKMWTLWIFPVIYCKCLELPGRDFPWWLSAAGSKQAIIDTASKLCWEEKNMYFGATAILIVLHSALGCCIGSVSKSLWVIKCLHDIEVSSMNHGGPFVHLSSWGKDVCQISSHESFCH